MLADNCPLTERGNFIAAPNRMTEMPYDTSTPLSTSAVRKILDQVKLEGRSALTAPEGKGVCDAYGIAVPTEVLPTRRRRLRTSLPSSGFPSS
jgi:hypothetical protein